MTSPEARRRHQVLIVGAGPARLSAALALRSAGVPATVLEKRGVSDARPGSRAAYIHGESLRHLERLQPGLGREIADCGVMWLTKRTLWQGREVYAKTYQAKPYRNGLPPFTSLPQVRTEDLMVAACQRAGVEFEWNREVVDVHVDPDGVVLTDTKGDEWEADYVIAADGARSPLRAAIGRPLEGPRSLHPFVVVDLVDDPSTPVPRERVFHYNHPGVGGRNVLIVPFAGGWRVDLNLRRDDDPDDYTSPSGLARWLPQAMPKPYSDRVSWVSTYRFAQQTAAAFTDEHRRIMLTGEAAHMFAPFGARGMNSSIPDAITAVEAAVTALGAGSRSAAAIAAVEAFATARLDAARYNRACATQALDHMLALRPGIKLRRVAAVAVAGAGRRAGRWLDSAPYGPGIATQKRPGRSY